MTKTKHNFPWRTKQPIPCGNNPVVLIDSQNNSTLVPNPLRFFSNVTVLCFRASFFLSTRGNCDENRPLVRPRFDLYVIFWILYYIGINDETIIVWTMTTKQILRTPSEIPKKKKKLTFNMNGSIAVTAISCLVLVVGTATLWNIRLLSSSLSWIPWSRYNASQHVILAFPLEIFNYLALCQSGSDETNHINFRSPETHCWEPTCWSTVMLSLMFYSLADQFSSELGMFCRSQCRSWW